MNIIKQGLAPRTSAKMHRLVDSTSLQNTSSQYDGCLTLYLGKNGIYYTLWCNSSNYSPLFFIQPRFCINVVCFYEDPAYPIIVQPDVIPRWMDSLPSVINCQYDLVDRHKWVF